MLHRFVLPSFLALLFLTVLCAAPSMEALTETETSCSAFTGADLSATNAGIRTHHAFPRCPEGEGFTEHNRRKQPAGSAASSPKFAGLAGVAVEPAPEALDVPTAPTFGAPVAHDVPHSYDPQGPPTDTV